jgi:hypothetical protein
MNLGSKGTVLWYPADQLTIAKDEVVRTKLAPQFAAQMIKTAAKTPDLTQKCILDHALPCPGLRTPVSPKNNRSRGQPKLDVSY